MMRQGGGARSLGKWVVPGLLGLLMVAVLLGWAVFRPGLPGRVPTDVRNLDPQAPVIGVEVNGQARAYPLLALFGTEVANDDLGGQPIVVTF